MQGEIIDWERGKLEANEIGKKWITKKKAVLKHHSEQPFSHISVQFGTRPMFIGVLVPASTKMSGLKVIKSVERCK